MGGAAQRENDLEIVRERTRSLTRPIVRAREELCASAPGARRRKYKDPIHKKEEFTHTSEVRSDVIGSKPMSKRTEINVAGKTLTVSNLEKVLYPEVGFTKGQVIDYYIRIAPVLLPHLKGRPITLKRYPEGVNGFFFYEKRCPSHRPHGSRQRRFQVGARKSASTIASWTICRR